MGGRLPCALIRSSKCHGAAHIPRSARAPYSGKGNAVRVGGGSSPDRAPTDGPDHRPLKKKSARPPTRPLPAVGHQQMDDRH